MTDQRILDYDYYLNHCDNCGERTMGDPCLDCDVTEWLDEEEE